MDLSSYSTCRSMAFREWCLLGLETLLKRLKERGMKAVSLGHLAELAQQSKPMSSFKTSL